MPSERNVRLMATLKGELEGAKGSFFLVDYQGLNALETQALRQGLKEKGARLFVAKNTLIRIALEELGLPRLEGLSGPSALVFYQDPVAAAKVLSEFAEKHPKKIPVFKGGLLQGQVLSGEEVQSLAKLPTLDELRAEFLGVLQAPMAELVGVLGGVARELVGILEAYVEKQAA